MDIQYNYDVSIIIINYRTSKLINDCIDSILRLTKGVSYEIIVVDNNTEDLRKVIKEASNPDLKLIQLQENVGFGRANNVGFEIAQGRNLFCLNPDTILLNNAVKILSDYLDANPNCGACGGNLYDENGDPIHSFRRVLPGILDSLSIFSYHYIERLIWGKNYQFNSYNKPLKVAYITGADLMIPHRVIKKVGGFDPDYFMYYEETDLCYRISKHKFEIFCVPISKIIHLVGQSHKTSSNQKLNINPLIYSIESKSRRTYFNKNCTKTTRIISYFILRLNCLIRIMISYLIQNKNLRDINIIALKNL